MDGRRTSDLLGPLNAVEQRFAPASLWARGDCSLLQRHTRVAIVGTRHPTAHGERRARKLVKALVAQHAIVVSGLAQGIDTVAHSQTLMDGGRTIASHRSSPTAPAATRRTSGARRISRAS